MYGTNTRDTYVQKRHPCNPWCPQWSSKDRCVVKAMFFQPFWVCLSTTPVVPLFRKFVVVRHMHTLSSQKHNVLGFNWKGNVIYNRTNNTQRNGHTEFVARLRVGTFAAYAHTSRGDLYFFTHTNSCTYTPRLLSTWLVKTRCGKIDPTQEQTGETCHEGWMMNDESWVDLKYSLPTMSYFLAVRPLHSQNTLHLNKSQ